MFTLHNPTKTADLRGYVVTSHPCPECNETISLEITPQQLYNYNQGMLIHSVLGDYTSDVRERFISGICGKCWFAMFGNLYI